MNIMKYSGYTMVEILLVFAMIAIIAGFSIPIYQSFQVKNYLDVAINDTVQALRRAQILSQAVEGDSSWGVNIDNADNNKITIFKGNSYFGRDTDYDETYELPSSINVDPNLTEVVYQKMFGLPTTFGDIKFISVNGERKTIRINDKGSFEFLNE